ncbi:MAG: hypothetical protein J5662_02990 [Clostridia bacterium]|nr:hypothetical protein [Clostridia bacterium]
MIFGILALVFGVSSRRRGYRRGKSLSAVIMGIITLALCAVTFVLIIL